MKAGREGYWHGRIELMGLQAEVYKLYSPLFRDGFDYGIELGTIDEFGTGRGARLFMAQDMKVYYASWDGWVGQDEAGCYSFKVIGPYDMRLFRSYTTLSPVPKR